MAVSLFDSLITGLFLGVLLAFAFRCCRCSRGQEEKPRRRPRKRGYRAAQGEQGLEPPPTECAEVEPPSARVEPTLEDEAASEDEDEKPTRQQRVGGYAKAQGEHDSAPRVNRAAELFARLTEDPRKPRGGSSRAGTEYAKQGPNAEKQTRVYAASEIGRGKPRALDTPIPRHGATTANDLECGCAHGSATFDSAIADANILADAIILDTNLAASAQVEPEAKSADDQPMILGAKGPSRWSRW
jgi:hypothetical protein